MLDTGLFAGVNFSKFGEQMTSFSTSHDQAFLHLGARAPGQQWSAFDVTKELAEAGEAKLLVTTIWNFHHYVDVNGKRVPNENGIRSRTALALRPRSLSKRACRLRKCWKRKFSCREVCGEIGIGVRPPAAPTFLSSKKPKDGLFVETPML